jgi:hypothetical protein
MRLREIIAFTALVGGPVAARAQQSGLLLGVRSGSDDEYRTYWIAPANGRIALIASGRDLIVPGTSGFRRVCVVGSHTVEDRELSFSDSVRNQPATPRRGACAHVDRVSDATRRSTRCENEDRSKVTFASDAALGIEVDAAYTCGAHPSGGNDVFLRSLAGRKLTLQSFLTTAEQQALRDAVLSAGKKAFEGFGRFDDEKAPPIEDDTMAHLSLEDAFGIERGAGAWQLIAVASCYPHVACGTLSRPFSFPFPLPKALVSHDALVPRFDEIRKLYPGATDAFASPSGDVVIVRANDALMAFAPKDGQVGKPVMITTIDGAVVMTEWATGRFVAEWTRRLKPILAAR